MYNGTTDAYVEAFKKLCKGARKGAIPLDKALSCIQRARGLKFNPPLPPVEILRCMQTWKWLKIENRQGRVTFLMLYKEPRYPRRFIQKIYCGWCGKYLKYRRSTKKHSGDSHGICKTCKQKVLKKLDTL